VVIVRPFFIENLLGCWISKGLKSRYSGYITGKGLHMSLISNASTSSGAMAGLNKPLVLSQSFASIISDFVIKTFITKRSSSPTSWAGTQTRGGSAYFATRLRPLA